MEKLTSDDAQKILNRASFVGLETLYVCFLSFKHKKPFLIKNISDKAKFFDTSYVHGYIVACAMFDLVEYTENDNMMIVVNLNEKIASLITDFIYKKAEEWEKVDVNANAADPTVWKNEILKIEQYFGIKS